MSEPATQPAQPDPAQPPTASPTPTPPTPPGTPEPPKSGKRSLEDLLANLDDDAKSAVLGEVSKARNEAKSLRDRVKAAEPKAAEYDKVLEAQKTAEQKAADAAAAAEKKAADALERVARAEIKAALAGVVGNADEILEDLNVRRFLTDDGEVDKSAVEALTKKYAAMQAQAAAPRAPQPDRSQASGGNHPSAATPRDTFAGWLKNELQHK